MPRRKTFKLESRLRERTNHPLFGHSRWADWHTYYTSYANENDRDQALETLNRKDKLFEYRPLQEL